MTTIASRVLGHVLLASIPVAMTLGQARPWSVDSKPAVRLVDATNDKAVLFGEGLVGATRLPNGNILVADRGEFSLKVFDTTGKLVKSLARKGSGPGEMIYI